MAAQTSHERNIGTLTGARRRRAAGGTAQPLLPAPPVPSAPWARPARQRPCSLDMSRSPGGNAERGARARRTRDGPGAGSRPAATPPRRAPSATQGAVRIPPLAAAPSNARRRRLAHSRGFVLRINRRGVGCPRDHTQAGRRHHRARGPSLGQDAPPGPGLPGPGSSDRGVPVSRCVAEARGALPQPCPPRPRPPPAEGPRGLELLTSPAA